MLGIVFFFTAFISTFTINGNPLVNGDLETIINILQRRVENDKTSEESSSASGGVDGHSLGEHSLKPMDVIDLIQQVNKKNLMTQYDNKKQRVRVSPNSANKYYQNHQYEHNDNYKKNDRLIDQLLEQRAQEERRPMEKHSISNRLIDSIKNKDDGRGKIGNPNDYSKIFVVLDPKALQNSRNDDDISSLVSRILSQSFLPIDKSRQDRNKLNRYKGFLVKNNSRRYRKDSKEMYGNGGGDSGGGGADMIDDYRPKRPRGDHSGGGGGGGGGRTAIPYIRHRGDIYEKYH